MEPPATAFACFQALDVGDGHKHSITPWLEQIFLIGNHLAEFPNTSSSVTHTVITLPTTELASTFLIAGLISRKFETLFNSSQKRELSLQDLQVGMHIQANSGQVSQKFSGIIEAINLNNALGGRITLKIRNQSKTLLTKSLRNIRAIDYEGNSKIEVGYWDPFNRNVGFENPWIFMGYSDAERLSRMVEPICCINAPKDKLNEEMDIYLDLMKNNLTLQLPLKELIAPVGDGRKAPFFTEINPTKNALLDFESAYRFEYQLLLGSRAIIENFDSPKSNNVISIIGRSEVASGSVASMILERYFSGYSLEKSYSSFVKHPSIELMTFGVTT